MISHTIKTIYFSFLLCLIMTGCKSNENSDTSIMTRASDTPEDFQDFYIAFHTDSVYQINHILFPLDGSPAAEIKETDDFKWRKEDWKLHNLDHFDPDKFSVHRDVVDSTLITEYIRDRNSGFGIKRRFAKFDDEWFLIYYSAMNPGNE